VINRNIPNVGGQISSLMAGKGLNIENMLNRSKKDLAYTIIDTNSEISEEVIKKVRDTDGVLFVRLIK
jgi:D-3-phosphoglycerate dehydrogenase